MDRTRRSLLGAGLGLAAGMAAARTPSTAAPSGDPRRLLERVVGSGFAPGLVGLLAQGDRVEVMPVGRMAFDGPPMRRDTIFRIASMTKPITAAAVMMLVGDDRLRLDEPVGRLLPELADRRVLRRLAGPVDDTVPARRAITVEDLLTFRLGWGLILAPPGRHPIQRAVAELGIVGFGPPDPAMPFDNDEWMKRLGTLPLFAQPGERWLYTTGSDIQGVLIARASGQPLSTFLAERIFGPLGMNDTGFHVPAAKIDRLATAYRPEGGQLVSAASIEAMTANRLTPPQRRDGRRVLGDGVGWGYGMSVSVGTAPGHPPPGSVGWFGGFGTSWRSSPGGDRTAILLTQRMFDGPTPAPVYADLERAAGLR